MTVKILTGDCRERLRELPDASVHCVVTSPPYWGLRSYGIGTENGELGLEPTPEEYVANMVGVFREVRRVLRPDGVVWLNLGDSYAGSGKGGNPDEGKQATNQGSQSIGVLYGKVGDTARQAAVTNVSRRSYEIGLKPKDLVGIPWRVAFALQADGWWLRQDIIWAKPSPMPESVTDRCTKAHEYIFLLSKSASYFYDAEAIAEEAVHAGELRQFNTAKKAARVVDGGIGSGNEHPDADAVPIGETRNKRSVWDIPEDEFEQFLAWKAAQAGAKPDVWTVATQPFKGSHFATFPTALIEPCILAGTSEKGCCRECGASWVRVVEAVGPDGRRGLVRGGKAYDADGRALMGDNMIDHGTRGSFNSGGATLKKETLRWEPSCSCNAPTVPCTVLDPFGGAGTTGLVADRLGRNAILCELNPQYAEMATNRLKGDAGMFASVEAA